jgi:hypothetical protein
MTLTGDPELGPTACTSAHKLVPSYGNAVGEISKFALLYLEFCTACCKSVEFNLGYA